MRVEYNIQRTFDTYLLGRAFQKHVLLKYQDVTYCSYQIKNVAQLYCFCSHFLRDAFSC
jgi:hypothetical protein